MELKLEIGLDQLIDAIRQLPAEQLARVKAEISSTTPTSISREDFQDLLLRAPVFSDEQITLIAEARNDINKWGKR